MLRYKFPIAFILLTLLLLKCSNSSSSQKLVGVWDLDCQYPNENTKYQLKTAYSPDGTFNTQLTSKFIFTFNTSLSGTYKVKGNQLEEKITYASRNNSNLPLPQIQVVDLDWINDDSFVSKTGKNIDEFKCLAHRASK